MDYHSTHSHFVLPIPRSAILLPIPSNRPPHRVQEQQFATPSPATPQKIRMESGGQAAAQDSAVSNFLTIRAFRIIVYNTSPPVFSHLTTHLRNARFTHSSSIDLTLDTKKCPHPKNHHHPPSLSRSWIRTNWVDLVLFFVLRVTPISACVDEDAFSILCSPDHKQGTQ